METHLNLAHRSQRKAEHYCDNYQFSEAIFHYTKASEYLEKAIINTRCDSIRSALVVQRNHSIEQIDFLKRRLYNKIQKDIFRLSVDQTNSKTVNNQQPNQLLNKTSYLNMNSGDSLESKYKELYNVMNKHDSLVNCLIDQKYRTRDVSSLEASFSSNDEPSSPNNENKKPQKENKETIDELITVNDKLRQWVHHLVNNLEKSHNEISSLKEQNSQLQKELTALKSSNTNKPFPELPPLEPPTLLY